MATITTLKSGDDTDTSVWSSGTVPVEGDKVTISKLGTATSRTTSAGRSIGTTSIPVAAGTGTILANEIVQFDGDPAYYEVQTGITASAGTLVLKSGLLVAVASGATLRNRGHKVRLTANRTWGDDTSTGVNVNGVLYWHRTNNVTLTVKGNYTVGATGTEDRGQSGDAITTVNAGLLYNYSAAMAASKWTYTKAAGGRVKHCGKVRRRKTKTTAAVSASATSIPVEDATGWAIGDVLLVLPTTPLVSSLTAVEQVSVSSVSGLNIGISSLTNAKLSGAYVLNLTSNITTGVQNASFGTTAVFTGNTSATNARDVDLFDSVWDLKDSGGALVVIATQGANVVGAPSPFYAQRSVFIGANANAATVLSAGSAASIAQPVFTECSAVATGASVFALTAAGADVIDCAAVGIATALTSQVRAVNSGVNNSNPANIGRLSGLLLCGYSRSAVTGQLIGCVGSVSNLEVLNQVSDGTGLALLNLIAPGVQIGGIDFDPYSTATKAPFLTTALAGYTSISGANYTQDPSFSYGAYAACRLTSIFQTGRTSTHEIFDNEAHANSDGATTHRGIASLAVQNKTSAPFEHSFAAAISNGETKRVVGYVRRDSAYGVGAMPSVTLSVPGLSSVVSSAADTADTWAQVDVSITNSTGSTQELTVTLTAAGAVGGECWFDGIAIYPFVSGTRHYGFVIDEANPFRVVDPNNTLSESAALALSGIAVNHTANTITVTAARTASEVYDYCCADWCASLATTAGETRHINSSDGASFATTYTVVLSGAGAISGRYSDANGAVVSATISGIVTGSRILIVRTDTSAVLANAIVSGASYSLNVQTASAIPISVVLRKASAAPFYQEWATTGSIDPVGGFAATANQQPD